MAAVLERELCSAESISSSGCSQHLKIHEDVKDYYGKRLQGTDDLVLNVCVTPGKKLAKYVQDALKDVHEEVSSRARCESTRPIIVFLMQQVDGLYITRFGMWPPRYYGCGLVIPECLEGCRVLDLGSGSGRDCYMLSKLVGEKGHVTGVDMTDEQIQVAKKFVDYHTQRFGFSKSNVDFLQGYIEKLGDIGLKDNSFDLVISNCVVNLSPDKTAVLKEAYRVLKDGGEMYFSDIYADCELPDAVRTHKILWGECLGGALWWKEFVDIAKKVGFSEPRLVAASKVPVENEELQQIVGDCKFVSATYRLFKVAAGVPRERSRVIYNGWIEGCREKLEFDINYTFTEGETVVVDEETAAILVSSRFADEFTIQSLGKVSPSSGECPPREPQSAAADPFWLSEHVAEGGTSSCSAACSVQSKGCC